MIARAERHFRKHSTSRVIRALVRHARKSGQDRAKVVQIRDRVVKRQLAETLMLWKIAHLEGTTKKIGEETAKNHYFALLLAKGITALTDYSQRKHRAQMKEEFANKHHDKVLTRKTVAAFEHYLAARREKKALYSEAMGDR